MNQPLTSGIYTGTIRHRRFKPKSHSFNYNIYMMAIDLDETSSFSSFNLGKLKLLAFNQSGLLAMHTKDYAGKDFTNEQFKRYILSKVSELGGDATTGDKVVFLGQVRCLGLYFSPVNFYFCYRDQQHTHTLVEVSNTPWGEKHYYLLDENPEPTKKEFHVSPFMNMEQQYRWRIKTPQQQVMIHIENHATASDNTTLTNPPDNKHFDATLRLEGQAFSRAKVLKLLVKHPAMTFKIVGSIYWQALKMFVFKRFTFIAHPNQRGQNGTNY